MGLILVALAVSIAVATFIENDFGSETARSHIYNATWFELLFLLGSINLLGSMIIHRVFRKSKLTILVFHLSFILIIIGAAITRYLGFTGIIHIREGQHSSTVISDEVYLRVQVLEDDATTPCLQTGLPVRDQEPGENYEGSDKKRFPLRAIPGSHKPGKANRQGGPWRRSCHDTCHIIPHGKGLLCLSGK